MEQEIIIQPSEILLQLQTGTDIQHQLILSAIELSGDTQWLYLQFKRPWWVNQVKILKQDKDTYPVQVGLYDSIDEGNQWVWIFEEEKLMLGPMDDGFQREFPPILTDNLLFVYRQFTPGTLPYPPSLDTIEIKGFPEDI